MGQTQFSVFTGGEAATLVAHAQGLDLGTETTQRTCLWGDVRKASRRDGRTLVLSFARDRPIQLAFSSQDEREAFFALAETAMSAAVITDAPARPSRRTGEIPLLTVSVVPGREVIGVGGMVTAHSVMSRDVFSDVGSDLKSVVGGPLKGMERAMGAAIAAVRRDLSAAAVELGCDRVVGVTVNIAGVGDKAQAIVMAGTAVQTTATTDRQREGESSHL